MPVFKILYNPPPKSKPAVTQSPRPASKRTDVSKYPKVPPGTRTYSIYNFPDPKNLMQLPDYDCRFCPAMFCSTDSWARHTYSVHSKLMCPVCHSEFENRTEYEHHQVLDHNQPPILHPRYFTEFGNKTCTFCDAEFPKFKELTKHIRERTCPRLKTMLTGDAKLPATKKYNCNFCNKVCDSYLIFENILNSLVMHKSLFLLMPVIFNLESLFKKKAQKIYGVIMALPRDKFMGKKALI
jgi:hypothetical protein